MRLKRIEAVNLKQSKTASINKLMLETHIRDTACGKIEEEYHLHNLIIRGKNIPGGLVI
jgi:hypothetical protein